MKNLLLLLLFISCSDNNFQRVEELNGFRIIGIQASASEVAPGGNSTLQLLVSDGEGAGRVINGTTKSCIDPGIALGASVSCDHDPSTVNGTYTIDFTNDADLGAADLYTGLATDTVVVTVPATIFAGRTAREQANGVGYITIFTFEVDGKTISAFKRVNATNRVALNTNPTITAVTKNGGALSKPTKGDDFTLTTNAPESYDFINVDGAVETKTEEHAVSWYVTDGKFDKPKSEVGEVVEYTGDAPAGTLVLITVVRDERGGFVYRKNNLP